MNKNQKCNNAKKNKNDEFYTRYEDVEAECSHYDFNGMSVMLPCDDPSFSNFFKYFNDNYEKLGLSKLVCTYKTFDGSNCVSVIRDDSGIRRIPLSCDGDFRRLEVVDLMRSCDCVVTNPPFSLWRNFVQLLIDYKLKFLIIGSVINCGYNMMIPFIVNRTIINGFNLVSTFDTPNGVKRVFCCWFTNMDCEPHYKPLSLSCKFDRSLYPEILNIDNCIYVNKISRIPVDYDGFMVVPVNFFCNWDPNQFVLLGKSNQFSLSSITLSKELECSNRRRVDEGLIKSVGNGPNDDPIIRIDGELKVLFSSFLIKKIDSKIDVLSIPTRQSLFD